MAERDREKCELGRSFDSSGKRSILRPSPGYLGMAKKTFSRAARNEGKNDLKRVKRGCQSGRL
jgi:hypothetical protein